MLTLRKRMDSIAGIAIKQIHEKLKEDWNKLEDNKKTEGFGLALDRFEEICKEMGFDLYEDKNGTNRR